MHGEEASRSWSVDCKRGNRNPDGVVRVRQGTDAAFL